MKGQVKWFNAHKGYGFITGEDGEDRFVHYSGIVKGRSFFNKGDTVDFSIMDGKNGPQACDVVITKFASEAESESVE